MYPVDQGGCACRLLVGVPGQPGVPGVLMSPIESSPISVDDIRAAAVAGSWYPDDPAELARMVDGFLDAVMPVDGEPLGLLVPHAGYYYSGATAACAFKQLAGIPYEVAVIIAADHQQPVSRPISVWARGGFATPLGVVPVAEELAQALVDTNFRIRFDPDTHAGEHGIEMALPFLQRVCPGCAIVPILMGQRDRHTVNALTEALTAHLSGRRAVVIASSDLSHYPAHTAAMKADRAMLAALETGGPEMVQKAVREVENAGIPNLVTAACGQGPIQVMMRVARNLGADTTTILGHATSAHAAEGRTNRVVGYGAVMLWRYQSPDLDETRRQTLLARARAALAAHLANESPGLLPTNDPELARKAGVFVTLRLRNGGRGESPLRGCVGHMQADRPLEQIVARVAVNAGTSDPRFPTLTPAELARTHIEISVLSPLHRVTDLRQIELGRHGLLLQARGRQGLLLPEVPTSHGWDLDTFLANLRLKAGLPADLPLAESTLYAFTTLPFAEPH